MNTKTMEQFTILDTEMLATVEGGWKRCFAGTAGGTLTGYVGWVIGSAIIGGAAGGGLTGAATFC